VSDWAHSPLARQGLHNDDNQHHLLKMQFRQICYACVTGAKDSGETMIWGAAMTATS
jgi:hypothetical protein